jgi:putative nucleotidyltransferase with HDIG domain
LSLRKKIFLFTAILVSVVFATALLLVQKQVESATLADNQQHLRATALALEEHEQDVLRNRQERGKLLARAPQLAAVLERRDRAAAALLARSLRQWLPGTQLLALVAADGTLLAADGFPGQLEGADLATAEPLRSALAGGQGHGWWIVGGTLCDVVSAPVESLAGGRRVGAVLVGVNVGSTAARHLRSLVQTDLLVVAADGRVLASSLPAAQAREVARRQPLLDSTQPRRIEVHGMSYLAVERVVPLDFGEPGEPGGRGGRAGRGRLGGRFAQILLRPLDGSEQLAYQIGRGLLLIGLAAFVLAFIFAWLGARRITLPLRRLSATMSEMARTGELESDFPSAGGDREVQLIEKTFRQLLVSLEESQRARERSYVEAVGAVVTAADARDHETTGHSFRVAHYAVALARNMGVKGGQLKAIEWGALLHDVGKMVVPDEILRKSGPLTDDEWHIMRQHPNWGFDMLAEVGFLQQPALEIVYSHHERWDGKGYPRGLSAEDIPLAARIFAAVDTYDAITSDRPYRRAHSHQAAIAELQRVSGQQLDPRVVEAFSRIPEVELRRLRELCKRFHPGLALPSDLFVGLPETGPRRAVEDVRAR